MVNPEGLTQAFISRIFIETLDFGSVTGFGFQIQLGQFENLFSGSFLKRFLGFVIAELKCWIGINTEWLQVRYFQSDKN